MLGTSVAWPVTSSASRRYSACIVVWPAGRSSSLRLSRSYAATAVVTSHISGTSRCAAWYGAKRGVQGVGFRVQGAGFRV